jgi:hypothetical protein
MNKKAIITKVASAKQEILEAEERLAKVFGEIRVAPRAEKTAISDVVGKALEKLKAARSDLEALEKIISGDE